MEDHWEPVFFNKGINLMVSPGIALLNNEPSVLSSRLPLVDFSNVSGVRV